MLDYLLLTLPSMLTTPVWLLLAILGIFIAMNLELTHARLLMIVAFGALVGLGSTHFLLLPETALFITTFSLMLGISVLVAWAKPLPLTLSTLISAFSGIIAGALHPAVRFPGVIEFHIFLSQSILALVILVFLVLWFGFARMTKTWANGLVIRIFGAWISAIALLSLTFLLST